MKLAPICQALRHPITFFKGHISFFHFGKHEVVDAKPHEPSKMD